jgi:hypothetical protein
MASCDLLRYEFERKYEGIKASEVVRQVPTERFFQQRSEMPLQATYQGILADHQHSGKKL